MSEILIHREHQLGLAQARRVARQWADEVEQRLQMSCTVVPGKTCDTVEFTRSGVNGRLLVAGDRFELQAKLGFLLGAFSKTIETEIRKNLDQLLGADGDAAVDGAKAAPARKAAASKGADKAIDKGADKPAPRRKPSK